MSRADGWELRFHDFVADWRKRPFDWAHANCLHMAVANVAACRGAPASLPELPVVASPKDTARALRKLKVKTIADVLARHFEFVPVTMAQRGDLGVFAQSTVVCLGTGWLGRSEEGEILLPLAAAVAAFRV